MHIIDDTELHYTSQTERGKLDRQFPYRTVLNRLSDTTPTIWMGNIEFSRSEYLIFTMVFAVINPDYPIDIYSNHDD